MNFQEVIVHPNYSRFRKHNDIALLKLSTRIYFNNKLVPACLNFDNHDEDPNVRLTAVSWETIDVDSKMKLI